MKQLVRVNYCLEANLKAGRISQRTFDEILRLLDDAEAMGTLSSG